MVRELFLKKRNKENVNQGFYLSKEKLSAPFSRGRMVLWLKYRARA